MHGTESISTVICHLRQKNIPCSQATFIGICRTIGCDWTDEELMALSAGFRGGIGCSYSEGSCGAFVAGVMALGMFLPEDNAKAVALSKELFTSNTGMVRSFAAISFIRTDFRHVRAVVFALARKSLNCWTGKGHGCKRKINVTAKSQKTFGKNMEGKFRRNFAS